MIASLLNKLRPRQKGDCGGMARAFESRLHRWSRLPRSSILNKRVGILVTPWLKTAVPYYSIEWALRLDKAGFEVEVLWDRANLFGGNSSDEVIAIRQTLGRLPPSIVFRSVLDNAQVDFDLDRSLLEKLFFENQTRQLGREPGEPVSSSDPFYQSFFLHAKSVLDCLRAGNYDWLLVPGGVWGVSGLYWSACRLLGIELTTYDAGRKLICLHHGGPAAHFPDVELAIRQLWNLSESRPNLQRDVLAWSRKRLSVREDGDDELGLQPKSHQTSRELDVVVPLNYRLDSAAMCRQRLFPSVNYWIRALVEWAENRGTVRIGFRQHPCEKLEAYRSQEDYRWINELNNPRIQFISAADPINSYDLIRKCVVVAPYCSRIGIEAAMLGKPVVLASHCYYDSLEFARKPLSVTEYFSQLDELVSNRTVLGPVSQRLACVAYYVVERFTLLETNFTPIPDEFWTWVNGKPQELWKEPTVGCLFEAVFTRKPLSVLLLERFLNSN